MILTIDSPQPKQRLFLTAEEEYVCYGGARGGGKSWALRTKAALLAVYHQGITILILRRSYPELEENHIEPLRNMLEGKVLGAKYNDKKKTLRVGKSKIIFGYCDTDNDIRRYQGNQYDVIFIDEATQFLWEWFDKLKGSVRGTNDFPRHIYLTCNPGDVGHAWVKRLFVDGDFLPNEDPGDYVFIPATVYDNPVLIEQDPKYLKKLESLSPEVKDAWLYGKWDSFTGQFFTEWRRDVHVIEPFDIPQTWRRYAAMDYGLDMLAGYLIAVSPNGQAYVYREAYQSGLIISDASQAMKELFGDDDVYEILAPPDMWNRRQETGKSVAEIFQENGIYLAKASNERVAGWLDMKEWLKVITDADGNQTAGLRVFSNCINLIRCIPLLQYDTKKVNDTSTTPHEITHAPDAIRYFCAGRPYAAQEKIKKSNPLPPALREPEGYKGGIIDW